MSQAVDKEAQQRVIDATPILTAPRITDAPPIMHARNPTEKRAIKQTPQLHNRVTWNNTPGAVPLIVRPATIPPPRRTSPRSTVRAMPTCVTSRMITQQAINVLTIRELATADTIFTPRALLPHAKCAHALHFEHYASPMVHPITGETISSYKKLRHDPATAEVWQTVFGKDFGGMAQGDNKTGEKGTNAMFVMTHDEITHALRIWTKFTYANPVVDHRPQKEDPKRIRITAGGNLINYDSDLSVRTADINTAKLHWNSVVSTDNAKYMCIDIKNFYLSAALEYFEYMRIPLALFPTWTIDQYNLNKHAYKGFVYIEM